MRVPAAAELLTVWEQGRDRSPAHRALLLLAACEEQTTAELAALPVGVRDGRLLSLREWTFGPALGGVADCPACGDQLELVFETEAIRADAEPARSGMLSLSVDGYAVRFRLPTSLDLAAIEGSDTIGAARTLLLRRCVEAVERAGHPVEAAALPDHVTDAIAARMAAADPQADVEIVSPCPGCGSAVTIAFDIGEFFWAELAAWSRRTLREVHLLASAYGWREAEILALSPARRQLYREMVTE